MQHRAVACSLCGGMYLPCSLAIHQKTCAEKQNSVVLPCPYCDQEIAKTELPNHVAQCMKAPNYSSENFSAVIPVPKKIIDSQGRIACPVCSRRFNQDRLAAHQKICKRVNSKPKRKLYDSFKDRKIDPLMKPATPLRKKKSSMEAEGAPSATARKNASQKINREKRPPGKAVIQPASNKTYVLSQSFPNSKNTIRNSAHLSKISALRSGTTSKATAAHKDSKVQPRSCVRTSPSVRSSMNVGATADLANKRIGNASATSSYIPSLTNKVESRTSRNNSNEGKMGGKVIPSKKTSTDNPMMQPSAITSGATLHKMLGSAPMKSSTASYGKYPSYPR